MDAMPDPINRFARFAHIVCSVESAALAVTRLRSAAQRKYGARCASGQNPGPGSDGCCKRGWAEEGKGAGGEFHAPVKIGPDFDACVEIVHLTSIPKSRSHFNCGEHIRHPNSEEGKNHWDIYRSSRRRPKIHHCTGQTK